MTRPGIGARLLGGIVLATGLLGGCTQSGPAGLTTAQKFTKWMRYEGEPGASHYSALKQIDKSNVKNLQVAWKYEIGDNSAMGMNPIVVDSTMYVVGKGGSVVALDAATGKQRWLFPFSQGTRDRGILYWESPDRSERRLYTTRSNYLYSIDALTGKAAAGFGQSGRADIEEAIGRGTDINATPSSPGTVWGDLIILGSGTGEGYGSGPGDIRAYDARTGKLRWIFHTIPHPGEFGYESWDNPEAWKTAGGANNWGGMSVDDARGIVYIALGSATYDFWGGDRLGNNLFANSLLALDARTGKRLWHFQTVHHDLWDYDLTTSPTLMTVRHNGKMVDAVVQAGKTGFLWAFDRVSGQPLWPVEERPVPASDMPGEKASPTQPVPTWPAPFGMQAFSEADINPFMKQPERDSVAKIIRASVNKGLFTPPSRQPTIQLPGNHGGGNWGHSAADLGNGWFYTAGHNSLAVLQLRQGRPTATSLAGATPEARGRAIYTPTCTACHGANMQGQPPLIPSLVGVSNRLTADQMREVIVAGRGLMPAHRELTPDEVNAVVAYLTNPTAAGGAPAGGGGGQGAVSLQPEGDPIRFEDFALRYNTGYGLYRDAQGMPWNKGPWNYLAAYDMNTGEKKWEIPLGESDLPGVTGSGAVQYLRGGPAVTAGGLLFQATEYTMRAYDSRTGQEIWVSPRLPAQIQGIPTVYEAGGRQFVAVGGGACGGGGGGGGGAARGTACANGAARAYVAFALPQTAQR
jgi:quinoprotein glucose dehydrogenase